MAFNGLPAGCFGIAAARRGGRGAARATGLAAAEAVVSADSEDIELRVLDGPQVGANLPWRLDQRLLVVTDAVRVATAPRAEGCDALAGAATRPDACRAHADILLFEPSSNAVSLVVTLGPLGAFGEVMVGEVWLGRRRLAIGQPFDWPMYEHLVIGRSVLAFGRCLLPSWPRPGASGGPRGQAGVSVRAADSASAAADCRAVGHGAVVARGRISRMAGWLAFAVVAFAVVGALTLWLGVFQASEWGFTNGSG
ncbi:MAG: hypothetical protein R3E87_02940 [Burkholderiaceae bacterium]